MNRPFAGLALVSVTIAVAGAVPAAAQEPGVVGGRVLDRASGTPRVGAYVRVTGAAHGVQTDSAGRYVLAQVPAGSRQVEATIAGYGTVARSTTVVPGDTSRLDFALLPAAVEPDRILNGVPGGPARGESQGRMVNAGGVEPERPRCPSLQDPGSHRAPVNRAGCSAWSARGRRSG